MAADIEASPVIERRGIDRRRLVVIGAGAEIGAERRGGEGGEGYRGEQELLHGVGLRNGWETPRTGVVHGPHLDSL